MSRGNMWAGHHVVYRCFDADGDCLYVGQTGHFLTRMAEHRRNSPWAREVTNTKVTVHPSPRVAVLVEAEEVDRLSPLHNATLPNPVSEASRKRIGAILRVARETRRLTPRELSFALGISRPYLMNIEAGRKALPLRLVLPVAKVLEVDPIVFTYWAHTTSLPSAAWTA